MKNCLLIIGTTLLMFCCKKKGEDPEPQKIYLTKEIFQSTGTRTWTYDEKNNLTGVAFASSNESSNPSFSFLVKELDAKGRVTGAVIDYKDAARADLKIRNVYNSDGKMEYEEESNVSNGAVTSSYTFQYTPTQVTVSYKNAAGVLQFSDIYTLSSDGNNVVKRERFNSSNVLSFRDVYSGFDDKKSAQSAFVPGFSVAVNSVNNFTTDTYTNAAGISTVYTYTYEYNSDGYAVKRISASGAVSGYEYIKK